MRFKLLASFFVSVFSLTSASGPVLAANSSWPAETGAKVPLNALAVPTSLDPVDRSLADILDTGAKVVTSYVGASGPVVTVEKDNKYTLCLLTGPDPKTDQNVPTSRCYGLN